MSKACHYLKIEKCLRYMLTWYMVILTLIHTKSSRIHEGHILEKEQHLLREKKAHFFNFQGIRGVHFFNFQGTHFFMLLSC